ncbi:MAG: roadblock/LC7 domain-containing protein [Planctomycetota bacterium]
MKPDQQIKEKYVLYYKDDLDRLDRILEEYLRLSKAKCTLLIDKDGHLVTKQGQTGTYDMDTISALVAGSFAATKEMAKLLGEEEFSVLFHQGMKDAIQLSLIGDRTLMATIFDDKTTVGMVRLYSNEAARKLGLILSELKNQKGEGPLAKGFGEAATGKLDEMFGKS